jgi:ParB family transcriptional regulator, chromosome partitioning protein
MGFTLNNIASDKNNQAAKRGDSIRVNIRNIKIVDGFNVRTQDDELREHIASLLAALVANLPIPAIEVWVNPETGDIELVDGHCRFAAYLQYADIEPEFDNYISAVKFEGTPFQRKMRIASSNKQLKVKPVELGRLYIQARDELGATRQEIAAEAGMSLAHVDQMILLASKGSPEIEAAIGEGSISATEAVKLVREFGDEAPKELERRIEVAAEQGKTKVTAKVVAPKPPSRPRVDMVVSNAVVLVNGLSEMALQDCERPEKTNILVDSHALADLIMAVREMQQAGKALDADRQLELIGSGE